MITLKDQWIAWNLNNPKDQIDWREFKDEHTPKSSHHGVMFF